MKRAVLLVGFVALSLSLVMLAGACTGRGSEETASSTSSVGSAVSSAGADTTTVSSIPKTVGTDGSVTLGDLTIAGFALSLPADAYPGVSEVSAAWVPSAAAPAMTAAAALGDGYLVDTGGVGRLDSRATLTYRFDPATTPDPSLLALGYHDGSEWTYVFATSVDTSANTVVFPLYHFSAYYPSQFKNELEAAKHYAGQMAAQKVLGENGGDPKVASRMLADLLAAKLGLGEDEFAKRMFADIAADQDTIKMFDEYMREGWTDKGYSMVMSQMCKKAATELERLKGDLTGVEANLKNMRDILKVGNAGSKILGFLNEGDTDAAGKELFDLVTDYTGAPGKAVKYTLQGMQNALDVWRDGEVEKAFKVYTQGSPGTLFGYGAVDPGDFDAVWDNMKGASRQLCVERIRTENQARQLLGLPPLTANEEDFYREKVKAELKSEFERRTTLKDRIEAQKKNLELIFTELDAAKLFDSTNVWIRKIDPNETLENRLNRFNHLIGRIFTDLEIETVYRGAQIGPVTDGRISATEMAVMLRGYFAADTQAEGEKFLQDYYAKLLPLDLNGKWTGMLTFTDIKLSPEAQAELEKVAQNPPEELEGCDLSSIGAILEQLKGKPCPMTLDITAQEGGTGSAALSIDFSALSESAEPQAPTQSPLKWKDNTITISMTEGGQATTITGTATKRGKQYVMTGTMTIVVSAKGQTAYTLIAEWQTTKVGGGVS